MAFTNKRRRDITRCRGDVPIIVYTVYTTIIYYWSWIFMDVFKICFAVANGCHRHAASNWQAKGSSSFGCVFQLLCHWLLTLLTVYMPSRVHNQLCNFFVIWSSHATNETCLRVVFVPLNDSGTARYKLPKLYGLRDYGQTDVALSVLAEPNWPQQSQKWNQQNTYPASNGRWMCVNSRLCNASRRKTQLTITPPAHSLSPKQEAITQDGHMSRIQGSPTTERWDSFWYWPIWTCVSGLTILHHSYVLFWARPFTGLV